MTFRRARRTGGCLFWATAGGEGGDVNGVQTYHDLPLDEHITWKTTWHHLFVEEKSHPTDHAIHFHVMC